MSEHQHFVRFEIRDEGQVRAEFHCTADENASCRRFCGLCINEERDRCECDGLGREPVLETYPCNYLEWMNSAPDECYDGPKRYVPGPGLAPVTFTWEGDYMLWDFAS